MINRKFLRLRLIGGLRVYIFGHRAGALLAALCIAFLTTSGAQAADFPLKASANGRYLVDQQGTPFLLVGDSAWSLIVQTTQADRNLYLSDRQTKGFNALIVNLIEHKYATHAPKTRSGLAPFLTPNDFSTPNPAYFDFAHQVIKQANDHGMIVFLFPAYLGYHGGDQGWYREMVKNNPGTLRNYGRFVGKRFKDLNIVWVVGGDYTPPAAKRWTVTAVAAGIHEADPTHLMTVHTGGGDSSSKYYGNQPWLTVDGAYLHHGERLLLNPVRNAYHRLPMRPVVLLESTYEYRYKTYGPAGIRRQAYGAMLTGACGQFFGSEAIWSFGAPGVVKPPVTWKQAINSTGTHDTMRLHDLFKNLPWYQLIPEQNHALVTSGYGTADMIIGAETADKTLAVIYIPSTGKQTREFTVDLSRFAGPVTARWYDPSSGRYTSVKGGAMPNHGPHTFDTPGVNSGGADDWILLMKIASPSS